MTETQHTNDDAESRPLPGQFSITYSLGTDDLAVYFQHLVGLLIRVNDVYDLSVTEVNDEGIIGMPHDRLVTWQEMEAIHVY